MSGISPATAIHNARVQLLARLLSTMAGTSFAVGVVAPVAAVFLTGISVRSVAIGALMWLSAAGALHVLAQLALEDLRSPCQNSSGSPS